MNTLSLKQQVKNVYCHAAVNLDAQNTQDNSESPKHKSYAQMRSWEIGGSSNMADKHDELATREAIAALSFT